MQPPPSVLTISAVRTIPAGSSANLQTQLELIVSSGQAATLDDITAALTAGGIGGASFYGVSSTTLYGANGAASPGLQWSFVLNPPVAMLKGILAQVAALEQSLAAGTAGLTLSASVQGISQAAASPTAPACDNAGLLTDARSQAQTVAAAAGLTAGNILTISNGFSSQPVLAQAVIGDFPNFGGIPVASPTQCSLTVQFQLI
jgi:hypothetical protein